MDNNINYNNNSSSLINPVVHEGELRILDIDLAQRLRFAKPTKIRELIKRHSDNLVKMGTLPTVGRVINGGNAKEFYLNRKQAIFITAKSETKEATEITIEIIERFEAYERGEINPFQIPQSYSEALRLAADQAETIKTLQPKADGYDLIATSDGSMCITNAAKYLQMKPRVLFDYLKMNGWIYRRAGGKSWIAYQDKLTQGVLEHKVSQMFTNDGDSRIREQVLVTPKGIAKLALIFSKEQA